MAGGRRPPRAAWPRGAYRRGGREDTYIAGRRAEGGGRGRRGALVCARRALSPPFLAPFCVGLSSVYVLRGSCLGLSLAFSFFFLFFPFSVSSYLSCRSYFICLSLYLSLPLTLPISFLSSLPLLISPSPPSLPSPLPFLPPSPLFSPTPILPSSFITGRSASP